MFRLDVFFATNLLRVMLCYGTGFTYYFPIFSFLGSNTFFFLSLLNERTWSGVFKNPQSKSNINRHPNSKHPHDPNNEKSAEAIKYWLQFSDFYVWPHITIYDSFEDLIGKIDSADLAAQSKKILEHNKVRKRGNHYVINLRTYSTLHQCRKSDRRSSSWDLNLFA